MKKQSIALVIALATLTSVAGAVAPAAGTEALVPCCKTGV